MTDDQGYGEIAAHGNPIIKTPHTDKLYAESLRFTDFHVDPTCSPTRAALATGRYSTRTGVWHTINGRSMMAPGELTLAEVFKANGYDTAFFGKWHIGDNYPCRPVDQGYDHVAWHLGGAISHSPDYWENDMKQTVRYAIGGGENPMTISAHDWLIPPGDKDAIWNQGQIRRGDISNGPWAIDVEQAGSYEITLHRWAPYLDKPMGMTAARLRVGDQILTQDLTEDATEATFKIDIHAGPTTLKTWLQNPGPERAEQGAYYLHVRLLEEGE